MAKTRKNAKRSTLLLQTFWTGNPLSRLERAALQSYVNVGYTVDIYTYNPITEFKKQLPTQRHIRVHDAREILPESQIFKYAGREGASKRDDAFSYLLFLRLVPAFPFFLVNLVPAIAGVRLVPFVTATALGVIPGSAAYAFAGTGLDSVIAVQKRAYDACLAAGRAGCHLAFDAMDILTPQLLGALVALGLLALVPIVVRRLRKPARA